MQCASPDGRLRKPPALHPKAARGNPRTALSCKAGQTSNFGGQTLTDNSTRGTITRGTPIFIIATSPGARVPRVTAFRAVANALVTVLTAATIVVVIVIIVIVVIILELAIRQILCGF